MTHINDSVWPLNGEEPADDENQSGIKQCLAVLSTPEYVMEPGVTDQFKSFMRFGGCPEEAVRLLSENYSATAQNVNILAEWMALLGIDALDINAMMENRLQQMIIKVFDPRKADNAFIQSCPTQGWWRELINYPQWRSLIYRLFDEHPECVFLIYTVKMIVAAGFKSEVTCHNRVFEKRKVFACILMNSIKGILAQSEDRLGAIQSFVRLVCHEEHTYVYAQMLLRSLSQIPDYELLMRRLSQELNKYALENNRDVTYTALILDGVGVYPQICEALTFMLYRKRLNPADITVLYRKYSGTDAPSVHIIRNPLFLKLLVDSIFSRNIKINPGHLSMYTYLLAYAASAVDTTARNKSVSNENEFKDTMQAIEKVHKICTSFEKFRNVSHLNALYNCIEYPVVGKGIMCWIEDKVAEPSYFHLVIKHLPLLDKLASQHLVLHQQIFSVVIKLFETEKDDIPNLLQLATKKMVLNSMVHLMTCNYVIPVVEYVNQCNAKGDVDISLIRHFVDKVLEIISPPYTLEFAQLFLPMVENELITGLMRKGNDDPVWEFINYCKSHFTFSKKRFRNVLALKHPQ